MELACQCPAVVCCRCAPTQKAQIVRLLQERTGKLTCAVGKGLVRGELPRRMVSLLFLLLGEQSRVIRSGNAELGSSSFVR